MMIIQESDDLTGSESDQQVVSHPPLHSTHLDALSR